MKKMCVSMIIEKPVVSIQGGPMTSEVGLPKGARGIMYAWHTKKAAMDWYDRNVPLMEIESKVKP